MIEKEKEHWMGKTELEVTLAKILDMLDAQEKEITDLKKNLEVVEYRLRDLIQLGG